MRVKLKLMINLFLNDFHFNEESVLCSDDKCVPTI